jgi:hypothetical protein
MRKIFFMALATMFVMVATPSVAQRGGGCEELRRACLMKDRLGEQGEGNCRRYRTICRGGYGGGHHRGGGVVIEERTQTRRGHGGYDY